METAVPAGEKTATGSPSGTGVAALRSADDIGSARRFSRDDATAAGRRAGAALPLSFRAPLTSLLRLPVLAYRYSLSLLIGRHCRYLPTCSEFADEALARHGAWAGGWMAGARVCRCHPWGGHGYDPVPRELPSRARWSRPWRYGIQAEAPVCEAVPDR